MFSLISQYVDAGKKLAKNPSKSKPWFDIFIDSLVVGGLAAVSVWTGIPNAEITKPVIIAFSSAFLLQIARYRGINTDEKVSKIFIV